MQNNTGSLQYFFLKNRMEKSCPGPASLLNKHSDLHNFFLFIQNFDANENKCSGHGIPEKKFSGRAHAENK